MQIERNALRAQHAHRGRNILAAHAVAAKRAIDALRPIRGAQSPFRNINVIAFADGKNEVFSVQGATFDGRTAERIRCDKLARAGGQHAGRGAGRTYGQHVRKGGLMHGEGRRKNVIDSLIGRIALDRDAERADLEQLFGCAVIGNAANVRADNEVHVFVGHDREIFDAGLQLDLIDLLIVGRTRIHPPRQRGNLDALVGIDLERIERRDFLVQLDLDRTDVSVLAGMFDDAITDRIRHVAGNQEMAG